MAEQPLSSVLVTMTGTVLGGLISALVTWLFYRKSSENLRRESRELRKMNTQQKEILQKLAEALDVMSAQELDTLEARNGGEMPQIKKVATGSGDIIAVMVIPSSKDT
ncbi:hypothetical protein [Dethiobacter alkaliphilus]|uniref:hypothetical protein n=1 Tax=Dethiobacter alkaliphilus TaxID=427926 RepID=UPI0022277CFF|nr:hypothetical protein [Dethiobacter alkaliphilus]MCW3490986.1 hypothetical protein [Dethiobacter alkaliphilus]